MKVGILGRIGLLASISTASCTSVADLPTERLATARLNLANGIPAGTVQVLGSGDSLTLAVAVTGLSQGPHGFHLHTSGACTAPDFKSAGGHLNPLGKSHGTLDPAGPHLGDLPNLIAGSNGTASATIDLEENNRDQVMDWLFDADGTAVVIHAGPDDYRTDPAGAAGSRVACGVLKRT